MGREREQGAEEEVEGHEALSGQPEDPDPELPKYPKDTLAQNGVPGPPGGR